MWKPEVGRLVLQSLLKHAKLPVVVLQGRAHRNQGRKGTTNGAEGAHRSDVAAFVCLALIIIIISISIIIMVVVIVVVVVVVVAVVVISTC